MPLKRTQTAAWKVLCKLLRPLGGRSGCVSPSKHLLFLKFWSLFPHGLQSLWRFQHHAHEEAGVPRLPATPLSWCLTTRMCASPVSHFPVLCQQHPAPSDVLGGATWETIAALPLLTKTMQNNNHLLLLSFAVHFKTFKTSLFMAHRVP